MFKKALIVLAALGIPALAWASCTHHVVLVGDKAVPCTTCCNESGCFTKCF